MKILKLNQKGIAHILAPIAFIGIFAVIGSIVMLRSHAESAISCYVSGPTSLAWGNTLTLKVHINNNTGNQITSKLLDYYTIYQPNQSPQHYKAGPSAPVAIPRYSSRVVWVLTGTFHKPHTKDVDVFVDLNHPETCQHTIVHAT